MQLTYWQQCSSQQQQTLLSRPAVNASARINEAVSGIIEQVRAGAIAPCAS